MSCFSCRAFRRAPNSKWDDAPFRPRSHSADDITSKDIKKPVSRKPSFTLNPPLAKLVRKAYKKNLARLRSHGGNEDRGYQSDDSAVGSLSDYTRPGTPELPEPILGSHSSARSSPLSEYDAPRASPYDVPPPPVSARSSLHEVPPASISGSSIHLEYDFPPPPKCARSSSHLEYDFPPPPKCAVSSPHLEYGIPPPPKCTESSPHLEYDFPPPPKYAGSSPHLEYDFPPPPKRAGSNTRLNYDVPPPPIRNVQLDYDVPPPSSRLQPPSSTAKVRSAPHLDYDVLPPPRATFTKSSPDLEVANVPKRAPRLNYEIPPAPRTFIVARSSPSLQTEPTKSNEQILGRVGSNPVLRRGKSPSPIRLVTDSQASRLRRTPSPRWLDEPCPCMLDHNLSQLSLGQDYDVTQQRDLYDVPPSPRPFESIKEENYSDISPTDRQERLTLKAILSEINAISRTLVQDDRRPNTKTLVSRLRMLAERMAVAAWKHKKPWAAELDRKLKELQGPGGHKAQQAVALAGFLDEQYGYLFRSKPPVAPKPTELSAAVSMLGSVIPAPPSDFVPAVKRVVLAAYRRVFASRTDTSQLCQAVRDLVETAQKAAELYPLVAPLAAVKERAADVLRAANRLDATARSPDTIRTPVYLA